MEEKELKKYKVKDLKSQILIKNKRIHNFKNEILLQRTEIKILANYYFENKSITKDKIIKFFLNEKNLQIDNKEFSIYQNGKLVPLTYRQFKLFMMFLQNINTPVTEKRIIENLTGSLPEKIDIYDESLIASNIARLNMAFNKNKKAKRVEKLIIRNIKNIGYGIFIAF